MKRIILLYIAIFYSFSLFSQNIKLIDTDSFIIIKPINTTEDDTTNNAKIRYILDSLYNSGYLAAGLYKNNNEHKIIKGNKYNWAKLKFSKSDKIILDNLGFDVTKWTNKYISPAIISSLAKKILTYLDNTGYPFAYVKLKDINFITPDTIGAKLEIVKNKKFYFDSIEITSGLELSTSFLENYLDIHPNDIYDHSKVNAIKEKINNLNFAELRSEPIIAFYGNQASIKLDLKYKRTNRFDILIGLQPDNTGVRKFNLTGNIRAELINKLGRAENLYFEYKNLSQNKQDLILNFNYPYIMGMPFGFDNKFNIYINNDKYRDVKLNLGVQYFFMGLNNTKVYWQHNSSRILNIDTSSIVSTGRLPDKLDLLTNSMGIQLNFNTLNYRFNPRRGWNILLDGKIGNRKILKNQQITSLGERYGLDFISIYDSIKPKSYIFDISTKISFYLPLSTNMVFKASNNSSWKQSERKLYVNELFRLGGNKLLRGFDEESIYCDFYTLFTLETRMIIDKNSFLFVFGDFAYIHNPYYETDKNDTPYGIGAGINFDTKNGILSISTAVGSQRNNPLDFKNVKIHIGYLSMF